MDSANYENDRRCREISEERARVIAKAIEAARVVQENHNSQPGTSRQVQDGTHNARRRTYARMEALGEKDYNINEKKGKEKAVIGFRGGGY